MRADHAHGMKLVILGRDGTLNRYRDDHVKAPEELDAYRGFVLEVAESVGSAAKGGEPAEQATIEKIRAALGS